MSIEQRDVRPFASVPALDRLFRHFILRYGTVEIEAGGRGDVADDVYLRAPVRLQVAADDSALNQAVEQATEQLGELELSIGDLSFAVVISSNYLKNTEFRHQVPLADLPSIGHVFDLASEPRPRPFRSPRSGCTVEAMAYLTGSREPSPLKPWRFGTWISRAVFDVITEQHFTGFTPKPLTPERKVELGLPSKAMRYITLGGVSPLEEGIGENSVEVWVDADLLAKMSATPRGKTSTALQRQLFVDAIANVVHSARSESALADLGWLDVKDSLLGRVIEVVAPSSSSVEVHTAACVSYLNMVKTHPARFLAFAEESAGVTSAFEAGMGV